MDNDLDLPEESPTKVELKVDKNAKMQSTGGLSALTQQIFSHKTKTQLLGSPLPEQPEYDVDLIKMSSQLTSEDLAQAIDRTNEFYRESLQENAQRDFDERAKERDQKANLKATYELDAKKQKFI